MNELRILLCFYIFCTFLLSLGVVVKYALEFIMKKKKEEEDEDEGEDNKDDYQPDYSSFEHNSISGYRKMDANFSTSDFEKNAREIFLLFCESIKKNKLSALKQFFEPEYYKILDTVRKDYEASGFDFDNKFEIVNLYISGWKRENKKDYMRVRIRVRNQSKKFILEWIFERDEDFMTGNLMSKTLKKCPNCGASLGPGDVTKCSHCRAVIKTSDFDWLVSSTGVVFEKERN